MKKLIVILTLVLLTGFFGGCAVIPAIITTGSSFAVPQTASLVITAAGTAHKTALIVTDERDMDDMLSDKMLTIQAEAILLTESGVDMEATCLNGDIYVAGEYETLTDRDNAISALEDLKGVESVKGILKQMPTSLVAMVEPTIRDKHAESVIETGLLKELHIKSANVDVSVVQGEAVIIGVVKDDIEAAEVVRIVENLRPKSKNQVAVTSILAIQDAYETGRVQPNSIFALKTQTQMLADTARKTKPALPLKAPVAVTKPSIASLAAYVPRNRTPWQKARLNMKHRILNIAKSEHDKRAKRELITLSSRVLKDTHMSIEGRLVRTMNNSTNQAVRAHVDSILHDIAPSRTERLHTLAMN